MWTSGAVGMWITVAAQSPRQVPGLSLTPPGNHPAAGMRRSRRPRAARLRSAGGRNGAADGQDRTGRRQMRPIRAVRMSRGPGPQRGRGTAKRQTRSPGSRTALRPSGPLSSGRAAAQPERDNALSGADRRAGDARSCARNAAQEAARARKAAGSARAELDWARQDPEWQAQVREDAAPDQAKAPAASEAQIAEAENAHARPQARARHAEADLQRAHADQDQTAGQAGLGQPTGPTRRRCCPGNTAPSNHQRRTSPFCASEDTDSRPGSTAHISGSASVLPDLSRHSA